MFEDFDLFEKVFFGTAFVLGISASALIIWGLYLIIVKFLV